MCMCCVNLMLWWWNTHLLKGNGVLSFSFYFLPDKPVQHPLISPRNRYLFFTCVDNTHKAIDLEPHQLRWVISCWLLSCVDKKKWNLLILHHIDWSRLSDIPFCVAGPGFYLHKFQKINEGKSLWHERLYTINMRPCKGRGKLLKHPVSNSNPYFWRAYCTLWMLAVNCNAFPNVTIANISTIISSHIGSWQHHNTYHTCAFRKTERNENIHFLALPGGIDDEIPTIYILQSFQTSIQHLRQVKLKWWSFSVFLMKNTKTIHQYWRDYEVWSNEEVHFFSWKHHFA